MTHDLYEARRIVEATERSGAVTQLGIQHHSTIGMRMLVHVIRDGAIGKVREAHTWSDIPADYWPIGRKPPKSGSAPERLHWDLWLGTGPGRTYAEDLYHPRAWRAWIDFGSGGIGDNGSHILDPVMWSLDLGVPESVRAESPGANGYTYPGWSEITWEFPGSRFTEGDRINVKWYDGGRKPSRDLIPLPENRDLPRHGVIFVGTEGAILFSVPPSAPQLLPPEKFAGYEYPDLDGRDHYMQWTNAIRGEARTTCPFTYGGPLTEAVLLGNVAVRLPGETLRWDSKNLRFTDSPKADGMVRRDYRKGWEVPGLS
jgi:predicted dehydrogenase